MFRVESQRGFNTYNKCSENISYINLFVSEILFSDLTDDCSGALPLGASELYIIQEKIETDKNTSAFCKQRLVVFFLLEIRKKF